MINSCVIFVIIITHSLYFTHLGVILKIKQAHLCCFING